MPFTYPIFRLPDYRICIFSNCPFTLCLITGTICGLIGALTGTLSFHLTWTAWGFAVIVSFFVSVGAISLLQLGIRMTGPCTASILSTLEPITSVLLGVIILDEKLTFYKGIGCIFDSGKCDRNYTGGEQEPPPDSLSIYIRRMIFNNGPPDTYPAPLQTGQDS
ncbi:MAG: DMT family transporter [Enterocloster sp.]